MSELTVIPRILGIPIVEHYKDLVLAKYEELSANKPDIKLPPLPEKFQDLPEKITALATVARERLLEKAAPLIAAADAFANSQLDVAETKFPTILKGSAEEVIKLAEERKVEWTEKAKATFEEKIKAPAIAIAKDLDVRSKSLVDFAQERIPIEVPKTETEYNYQRALNISKAVTDKGVIYSTEQLKQIQEKNAFVARAAEKAKTAAATAQATAAAVPARVQELKEKYAQAEKIKEITTTVTAQIKEKVESLPPPPRNLDEAKELSTTLISKAKELVENRPPPPPEWLEFTGKFAPLWAELLELAKEERPLKEKVPVLGKAVVDKFQPEAELIQTKSEEIVVQIKTKIAAL